MILSTSRIMDSRCSSHDIKSHSPYLSSTTNQGFPEISTHHRQIFEELISISRLSDNGWLEPRAHATFRSRNFETFCSIWAPLSTSIHYDLSTLPEHLEGFKQLILTELTRKRPKDLWDFVTRITGDRMTPGSERVPLRLVSSDDLHLKSSPQQSGGERQVAVQHSVRMSKKTTKVATESWKEDTHLKKESQYLASRKHISVSPGSTFAI